MLLDAVLGVLGAVVFADLTGAPLTPSLAAVHIVFMLLPDADFLLQAFRKKTLTPEASHRHLLHNPLVYIPVGVLAIAPFSVPLAGSFVALSLAHFLHDSFGLGWGVRWLYPFSRRSYKFFAAQDGTTFSRNVLASWDAKEEEQLEARWNPNKDWFRRVYLRAHPIALVEHALTLAAAAAIARTLI